jgi:hypothetical protein
MHKLILDFALAVLIFATSFLGAPLLEMRRRIQDTKVITTKYSFGQMCTRLEASIEKSSIMWSLQPAPAPAQNTRISKFITIYC